MCLDVDYGRSFVLLEETFQSLVLAFGRIERLSKQA